MTPDELGLWLEHRDSLVVAVGLLVSFAVGYFVAVSV